MPNNQIAKNGTKLAQNGTINAALSKPAPLRINKEGRDLIKHFEGVRLTAYHCSAGVPTIGMGNTRYSDGKEVKMGDKITMQQAEELFELIVTEFENKVRPLLSASFNVNQFSALVSFAYNVGVNSLRNSTLLRIANKNPNDPNIALEFAKWNKVKGKPLNGLTRRRKAESDLYFKK